MIHLRSHSIKIQASWSPSLSQEPRHHLSSFSLLNFPRYLDVLRHHVDVSAGGQETVDGAGQVEPEPLTEKVSPGVGRSAGQDVGFGQVLHHLGSGGISSVGSSFLVWGEEGRCEEGGTQQSLRLLAV